jgi:hypothetical protein
MRVRSSAIWITASGIVACAFFLSRLGFFEFLVIIAVANVLDRKFGDEEEPTIPSLPKPEVEVKYIVPAGHHLIKNGDVKQIRNLLLRHHNMKQTDKSYVESKMSRETGAIVASLNDFLKGKR